MLERKKSQAGNQQEGDGGRQGSERGVKWPELLFL